MQIVHRLRHHLRMLQMDPITRSVIKKNLTYLSLEKLVTIEGALAETAGLAGDILEFGVALGGSGIILASKARHDQRFFGFDVFAMIPPPTSEKDDEKSKQRYEIIRSGKSEGIGGEEYYGYRQDLLSGVKSSFIKHNLSVDNERIILCQGLFEETWPKVDIESISLVHIDCDWYDPVLFCLQACADKLSPGGIIIVDDYNDYGGCRTATDEFIASRKDFSFEQGRNPFLRKMPAVGLLN